MKIIVVQDYLRSGGTERQSVLLANAFADAGHDTTLITFRPGGALATGVAKSVQRVVLQTFDTTLDWFAPGLHRAVASRTPEVILCMGRMANCYAGGLQQRNRNAVVVSTLRTGKPLPWLFQRSLRAVRHVIANSRDARDVLVQRHAVPAQKVSVIYNSLVFSSAVTAPAATQESSVRDSLRREHGATRSTVVLLCVAMFRPEKNQRELIEIAAGLNGVDWQLWLAGDGPARASCEALVREKNLGLRVKFPGWMRDPSPLYAAADVAVHASSSESLSNFLIEAQSHGLPAVAFSAQGISETFVPNQTGWEIARGDREAFRAAIARLAGCSEAERNTRASTARLFAQTTFDSARQVAAYLELMQSLVNTRGG